MLYGGPLFRRPVGELRFANHVAGRGRPAVVRVIRAVPIVAENKVLAVRNDDRLHRVSGLLIHVGLVEGNAVYEYVAVVDLHRLTRQSDNSLDERVLGIQYLRWKKNDSLAPLGFGHVVDGLVHDYPIAILYIGQHTGILDLVALHRGLERNEDSQSDENGDEDLAEDSHNSELF